jgi:hypothetical protein
VNHGADNAIELLGCQVEQSNDITNCLPEVTPRELPSRSRLQVFLERDRRLLRVTFDHDQASPRAMPGGVR